MKRKLSLILCIALILCMIPTTSAFAAKKVKAKSISLAPKSMTLMVGDVAQLNATMKPAKATDKLTWKSSNKEVATVTSKGVVQGVSEGNATITVTTASKKKATCTVTVKDYVDENELRAKLKEELKAEFATKKDIASLISQNTYTKAEIDSKISSIAVGDDSNSCNCETKTNEDVGNVVKQNTYTKAEIDAMIATISSGGGSPDWEDGTELTCISPLPKKYTHTTSYNGTDYSFSITINSIECKKYRVMDYVQDNYGMFAPYRYDFSVSYTVEGWEQYVERLINAGGSMDFEVNKPGPEIEMRFLNEEERPYFKANYQDSTVSFSSYSNSDSACFYIENVFGCEY